MDAVYPTKLTYRAGLSDPLKWSLRTLWHHLEGLETVVIVGDYLPEWASSSRVEFVQTSQTSTKFTNIGENLRAAADAGLSDPFLWLNDDIFLLEDWPTPFPLLKRPEPYEEVVAHLLPHIPLTNSQNHLEYVKGMAGQLELLKQWGLPTEECCELHTPIPLHQEPLKWVLAQDWGELEGGHFRGLYGGRVSGELKMRAYPDPKIREQTTPLPRTSMVSTSPRVWRYGKVGNAIRERYWRKSPYER